MNKRIKAIYQLRLSLATIDHFFSVQNKFNIISQSKCTDAHTSE